MAVTIKDFTGGATQESGLFEELMRTVESHTKTQFEANRLTGKEFSTVYLGSLQSAMSSALQFTLTKETTNKQIELLAAQVSGQLEQNKLIVAQTLKLASDTAAVDAQAALTNEQLLSQQQQTANLIKQGTKLDKENLLLDAQLELTTKQALKLVQDTALVTQTVANAVKTGTTIDRQQDKLVAETAILSQKKYTEQAQTMDTVNGAAVAGILGKQKLLYAAQTSGFARDAEQKAATIMSNLWSLQRSTDSDTYPTTGMSNDNIDLTLLALRQGVSAV